MNIIHIIKLHEAIQREIINSDNLDKEQRDNLEKHIINILHKHKELYTYQDHFGSNLGMTAGDHKLQNIVIDCLKNSFEASIQQDRCGWNIGMTAADQRLEEATYVALDNKIASKQQNITGSTIGILAIKRKLDYRIIEKAYNNRFANNLKDIKNKNFYDYFNTYRQENKERFR